MNGSMVVSLQYFYTLGAERCLAPPPAFPGKMRKGTKFTARYTRLSTGKGEETMKMTKKSKRCGMDWKVSTA